MNSQAEVKSDKNSVAALNMRDIWLTMLQGDEQPSLHGYHGRAQSLETNKRAKIDASHTVSRKMVDRVEKLVLPSLVA